MDEPLEVIKMNNILQTETKLKEDGIEKKNPLQFIVSMDEFKLLQKNNSDETAGLTYEQYCETEREGWFSMFTDLFYDSLNMMGLLPVQKFSTPVAKKMAILQALCVPQVQTNDKGLNV